jgi:membrane protease YdiL (CAAX protease family)
MRDIFVNIMQNFFLSLLFAFLLALLLLSLKVNESDLFGYMMVGFSLIFVSGYFKFSRRCSTHISPIPLIGSRGSVKLCVSLAISIFIFMFLVTCVSVFHGEMAIAKNLQWTNFSPLIFIVSAAAMEEVLCRGYLFEFFRVRFGVEIAAVIASVLFALAHYPYSLHLVDFLAYFSFAICLTMVAIKFNSLLPGIVYHSVSNYGVGLTRLDLEGIFSHPGIFRFENGDPSNAYMLSEIATFSTIAFIFYTYANFEKVRNKVNRVTG